MLVMGSFPGWMCKTIHAARLVGTFVHVEHVRVGNKAWPPVDTYRTPPVNLDLGADFVFTEEAFSSELKVLHLQSESIAPRRRLRRRSLRQLGGLQRV